MLFVRARVCYVIGHWPHDQCVMTRLPIQPVITLQSMMAKVDPGSTSVSVAAGMKIFEEQKSLRPRLESLFKLADRDGDGSLDEAEWAQLCVKTGLPLTFRDDILAGRGELGAKAVQKSAFVEGFLDPGLQV